MLQTPQKKPHASDTTQQTHPQSKRATWTLSPPRIPPHHLTSHLSHLTSPPPTPSSPSPAAPTNSYPTYYSPAQAVRSQNCLTYTFRPSSTYPNTQPSTGPITHPQRVLEREIRLALHGAEVEAAAAGAGVGGCGREGGGGGCAGGGEGGCGVGEEEGAGGVCGGIGAREGWDGGGGLGEADVALAFGGGEDGACAVGLWGWLVFLRGGGEREGEGGGKD